MQRTLKGTKLARSRTAKPLGSERAAARAGADVATNRNPAPMFGWEAWLVEPAPQPWQSHPSDGHHEARCGRLRIGAGSRGVLRTPRRTSRRGRLEEAARFFVAHAVVRIRSQHPVAP